MGTCGAGHRDKSLVCSRLEVEIVYVELHHPGMDLGEEFAVPPSASQVIE